MSPQVSRTLLSILVNLDNAVLWMVSTSPLISKSLYKSFGDCNNYNWYKHYFHVPQVFQFPCKVEVLICCIRWLCNWSFLLYHHITYICCIVLSILALIWMVLMVLFCAAIWRDSVSLLRFPFLNHIHVFSFEMLLISRLKGPWSCFSSHLLLTESDNTISIFSEK